MRRSSIMALVFLTVLAGAQTVAEGEPQQTPPPRPTVVSVQVIKPPKRIVKRTTFVPAARPAPAQVPRIVAIEAARWRVPRSRLAYRIHCESTNRWWAYNVGHYGLGQFLPSTFARGVSTMPRRVEIVGSRRTTRYEVLRTQYSDGRVTRERGRQRRPVFIHVRRGWIPRSPPLIHGWAQVRITAQAMAGRSAVRNGEWAAKCQ